MMRKVIGKINIGDIAKILAGEAIIAVLIAAVFYGICTGIGVSEEHFLLEKDTELTFLSISFQVIFLTTSLLSLLSDKEETVFWERFTEYVLINPRYFNFIGLSTIGYFTLLLQTIAYFLPERSLFACGFFYSNFLLGIVAIVILCYKMSSVYFNREYYVNDLRKVRLTSDNLNRLKEFSFVAADKFNGRVVKENMTHMLEKSLDENDPMSKEAAKGLVAVFEHLYIRELESWIVNFFEDNLKKIDQSSWLYREIVFWIMEDVSRVELWHAFISVRGERTEYKKMISCVRDYIKEVWDSLPIRFREGSEECLKQASIFESNEVTAEIRHIIAAYENKISVIISFIFDNSLSDEQEELIAVFLETPDPIFCKCSINPLRQNSLRDGIIQRIIRIIKSDDYRLLDFILAYDLVVTTMAHPDVKWDNGRDDAIATMLMHEIENKEYPSPNLSAVFLDFMVESVPCVSEVRRGFIKNLAEKVSFNGDLNSIRSLTQFVSYDYSIDEMFTDIADEDLEEHGFAGEEAPNDDRDRPIVTENNFTRFWDDIRDTVSSGKADKNDIMNLLKLLDDYIEFMKQ